MKLRLFKFNGIHIVFPLLVYVLTLGIKSSIAIFPFVFYRNVYIMKNQMTKNHMSIHIRQQMECGLAGIFIVFLILFIDKFDLRFIFILPIFFYQIIYGISYIYKMLKYKEHCMFRKKVCFEGEAYNNCNRSSYLQERKIFSWIKYI